MFFHAKYGFSFDISKDVLTIFSNHRDSNGWSDNPALFVSSELKRIEQLKDTNFDESERDALLSATLYWTSYLDISGYHTHDDCPELLNNGMGDVQSGTFYDVLINGLASRGLCDACAKRDAESK